MTQQRDSKGELRAAYTSCALENAKRSFQTGTTGVFLRVTLAVIFMYLVFISYLMLGIVGPVFISVLFLIALFVPYLYQAFQDLLDKRRVRKMNRFLGREYTQEG